MFDLGENDLGENRQVTTQDIVKYLQEVAKNGPLGIQINKDGVLEAIKSLKAGSPDEAIVILEEQLENYHDFINNVSKPGDDQPPGEYGLELAAMIHFLKKAA